MAIATDGKGNYLTLEGDKWVPAQRSRNEQTGQEMVLDGGQWQPVGPTAPQRSASEAADAPLPSRSSPQQTIEPRPQSLNDALGGAAIAGFGAPSIASDAVNRVVQAGVEGYQGVESTQPVQDIVTRYGGIAAPPINALLTAGGVALGGGAAAYRAAQQAGIEMISPLLGPQAARDIVSIPDAFAGSPGMLHAPGRPPVPGSELRVPGTGQRVPFMHSPSPFADAPLNPRFVGEYPDGGVALPGTPSLQRLTGAIQRADEAPPRPTSRGAPEPEAGLSQPAAASGSDSAWVTSAKDRVQQIVDENAAAGGPQSLSAARTPPADAQMAPSTVKAYRRMAELDRVVTPIEGQDFKTYVEGSIPTEAEGMGNAATSQKEVMTRQRNPDAFEGENGRLTQNNKARVKAYDDVLITDVQADDIRRQQQASAEKDHARIMATAKPVDLQPVARWVDQQLADPRIKEIDDVRAALTRLRNSLYDENGNLKSDPGAVWGMHDNLRNMLQKGKDPLNASSTEKFAADKINVFKKLVDGQMVKATDGQFQGFLDSQAEFLKQLTAHKLMQDFRYKGMIGKNGMINANAFHRFVTDLAMRRGRPGIDAAMDVPDEVFGRLMDINDDLKRAGRIDLGKPRGSPTNLYFELAQGLGIAGAHAITTAMTAGTPLAGVANVGLQTGISGIQRRMAARQLNRLTREALSPPNQLLNPGP